MDSKSAACDIETVEQSSKGRTEEPVAQKICGKVHRYGGINVKKSYSEKEMYGIIDGSIRRAVPIMRRERR